MLKRQLTNEIDSPGGVMFKKPRAGEMPYYELPDNKLAHGASLGNKKLWVNTKATGAIERVFCNGAGMNLFGSIVVTYALPSKVLLTASPEPLCLEEGAINYVLAGQEGVGMMQIYPFRQRHSFDLSGEMHVEETVLVPKLGEDDPPALLQHIEVTNESDRDITLLITVYADLQGDLADDLVIEFDERLSAMVVYNESRPDCVRLIGAEGCEIGYRTTHDISEGYAGQYARRLDTEKLLSPAPIGQLQLDVSVRAGESAATTIVAVATNTGVEDAKASFERADNFHTLLRATLNFLTPAVSMSMVETPDPIINQGVFWAKVNMMKVMADYPQGTSFTNEPGRSSNVVARDVAWFVYGCDFLDPSFSKKIILKLVEKQYDNGKIPEYYNALDGHVEDYGISMNDDTPLFILAACHHYVTTHDDAFLKDIYESVKKAADYIMSQRNDMGLVISIADGYEVYGIASWRNVIPDYQINGAVTEINSECFAALQHMGSLARVSGNEEDAAKYNQAANDLQTAINYALLNQDNGLYYLNIDTEGRAHTDVTADEIFPVLFGVAPEAVEYRIISRLRADDFMTPAGLRTVPRNSPDYEPTQLVGLRGGVWPGVAFWYALASVNTNPGFMVDALHASYLQYLLDPLKNNTVPGQFSEWFDGESLVNRGMRLSPWEPPRLLWAAVEGLCGAKPGPEGFTVAPARPSEWSWLALRRMACTEGFLTFFATFENGEVQIYSNRKVKTEHQLHVAGDDVTRKVRVRDYRVHRAAFASENGLLLCLGSEASLYLTALIEITDVFEPSQPYTVRIYSRGSGWVEAGTRLGADLSQLAVSIEDGGFRIITMTAV